MSKTKEPQTWQGQVPPKITVAQWVKFLHDRTIFTPETMAMVYFVYHQKNRQSSASVIADVLNFTSQQQVTGLNRSAARKIYEFLKKEPPLSSEREGFRYWNLLFDGIPDQSVDDQGKFIWKLRPNLVRAIKIKLEGSK